MPGSESQRVVAFPGHVVQFYDNDRFLCAAVEGFLAEGVAAGQPIIVIATEPHRRLIAHGLKAKGFDPDAVDLRRTSRWIDASELLATFMVGRALDRELFRATVGCLIETSRRVQPQATVRAYGEMVDLLWQDGNRDAAVHLEWLWNDLARSQRFTLLCAYAMAHFADGSHAAAFADICRHHAQVIPTEQYARTDDEGRLREISLLQQQARALTTEIARREALEQRLRDALGREQAARAEAERAARGKSDVLAVMSHELRTPLNAIGGYVQLVEMGVHGAVTDAQRDALARVQCSQRHLLSLIDQVLNFARIEQGRIEYALETLSVPHLIADSRAMVEPLLAPKRLTCAIALAAAETEEPILVRGDRDKIQQIMLNLLSNAIKFTPPGGRITVDAACDPASPDLAQIRVRDTGVGIAESDREIIFAPFTQVGSHAGSRLEGVGLGLAISRDLARGMGGDLTVASIPSGGSTFTLSVPLA